MGAEELVMQVLLMLVGPQALRDNCVVLTNWALPKYFALRSMVLPRPPTASPTNAGACGHPTTFKNLTVDTARRLVHAARPQGPWFARKFAAGTVITANKTAGKPVHMLEDFVMSAL